eukprot:scaffold45333_cov53-Attheya_sp.AAC.2
MSCDVSSAVAIGCRCNAMECDDNKTKTPDAMASTRTSNSYPFVPSCCLCTDRVSGQSSCLPGGSWCGLLGQNII